VSSDRDRLRALPAPPGRAATQPGRPSFGTLLRRFRRAAGLTQEQLAERTGLSVAGISALERGAKASPQRETVRLLVEALALPPDAGRHLVAAVAPRQPPIATKVPRPHPAERLPPLPGPLIGRERELAELATLLADSTCRLVTLTGPGGIGKTCLAIQAAADGGARFAGGAVFVALAPVRSAALLAPAIADALALPLHGQREPHEQVLDALRGSAALLVLDNFEHLLAGTPLVAALLTHAPALKIIATSRERLRLREEWVVAVEGLAVPEEGAAVDAAASDAVRLFIQRARQAQAGFAPGPAEWPHVARICRLVGGMPLGIELAAAWVPVLPCAEIAREIARGLDILATAPRDAPGRHGSMRAAFDHSWRLLPARQRAAFRQLAVFQGGFDRAAAEAVAGANLATLSALVGKSFLRRTTTGRYAIHELLRQYGADRLDADPEEARLARGRHCAYFVAFLARREGRLRGGEQEEALADIDEELENVRMAWHEAVGRRDAALVARATEGLWLYHTGRGRVWEGEATFASAVAALEGEPGAADAADATREAALGMALAR
jgi:predicted ATPase/DNA-binding XRE family transcriptional regulator